MSTNASQSDKESAAKKGIAAGTLLTIIELFGGIVSGSLGLISSALNTIVDLIASIIAFLAVRVGGKPPDESHTYGHEKIEGFAALIEVSLLLVVCVWLVHSALVRLISGSASIEYLWLALGTNFASILIDSYAYLRIKSVSRKHGSEALGAGALHFLNDLLIAIVVILGLVLYGFGLWYADSVAALGVVAATLYASMGVVKRSTGMLMDAAPRGAEKELRSKILNVDGVKGCHRIRVRRVGLKHFVDAHVEIEENLPLSRVHFITDNIESEIGEVFPDSDTIIHTEPFPSLDAVAKVRSIALSFPEIKSVHEINVNNVGGIQFISYHLEIEASTSLEKSHEIAHQLETSLKQTFGNMAMIISHLEPTIDLSVSIKSTPKGIGELRTRIIKIVEKTPGVRSANDIHSFNVRNIICVALNCTVDGTLTLSQAHEVANRLEESIKATDPRIGRVIIHCEPFNRTAPQT